MSAEIAAKLQSALTAHEAGQLDAAERAYRQVLRTSPDHPDALHLLGVLCADTNRLDESIALLVRAVRCAPHAANLHASLGNSYRLAGHDDQALATWRRAEELDADLIEPRAGIAALLRASGQLAESEAAWRDIIRLQPEWDEAYLRLGELLLDSNRASEAEPVLSRALQLAERSGRAPAESQNLLGCAYAALRKFTDAAAMFNAVVERDGDASPGRAPVLANLGQALSECGRMRESAQRYREALAINPELAEAHHGLAVALRSLNELADAEAEARIAARLAPRNASVFHGLGNILHERGQVRAAIDSYRHAIAIDPGNAAAHSSLLLVLGYERGDDAQAMFDEHVCWARQHAEPLVPASDLVRTNPNGWHACEADRTPLRIGYVSPDFRDHAVSYFFEPLLAAHDRRAFHVTCYASVRKEDATSARLRGACDVWRNVSRVQDEELADIVRADQIDILIDLAGHTAHNALLAFARRPAPVQFTYLGYPNTTGLRAVDYVITDTVQDRPGTEAFHTEQVIRLPRTMHCYRPPDVCPEIAPRAAGPVGFGSFNRLEKMSDIALDAWCRVLRANPDSSLTMKSAALADEATRSETAARFESRGVAPARLILLGRDASQREHFARYHDIDIALDSYPYSGTTTTCEALWMGVPVVSLAGQTRVARTTAGILDAIGLQRLIAHSPDEFVSIATALSSDGSLAALRATMRQRMRSSPLMDGASLARALEREYRTAWRKFCES